MPTPGNSINEATTGICGFTGTSFTSTPVTNHGVVLGGSTSSTLGNVGPTATAGQVLQSAGSSADPAFSTATYPSTTTVSQVLYSSSTNVVGGLSTANNGLLVTSNTGVPSILAGPGTTGQVLQANAAAAPSFSTASYPSTTTINQILYSSAANTVAGLATANDGVLITSHTGVPSLLANGTTGQVLTATTGAPPSWSTVSSFTPNSVVNLYDDFIAVIGSGTISGSLSWSDSGNGWLVSGGTGATSGHPGVIGLASTVALTRPLFLGSGANFGTAFFLGGGVLTVDWVFNIATASNSTNRYKLVFGLGDTNAAAQANGCWVQYSDNANSGNWTFNTASASSATNSNSSTAVTTGWHHAQIVVNAAATSVQFNMDGVSLGTAITTNIPTAAGITPFANLEYVAGTIAAGSILIDMFSLSQTLTTAR